MTKLITKNRTSPTYLPFVNDFVSLVLENFPAKIHSIYICGSIPKGKAVPYSSDADFTLVFHEKFSQDDLTAIERIKGQLLQKFPFLVKIDTPTVTVSDVLSQPCDWGFWISIISLNIYGDDLAEQLPDLRPDKELVIGINSDTLETLDKLEADLSLPRNRRKLSRRLIIALFTLVLPEYREWTDSVGEMKDAIIKYYPPMKDGLEYLYGTYKKPKDSDRNLLQQRSKEARDFFERKFPKSSSGTPGATTRYTS